MSLCTACALADDDRENYCHLKQNNAVCYLDEQAQDIVNSMPNQDWNDDGGEDV